MLKSFKEKLLLVKRDISSSLDKQIAVKHPSQNELSLKAKAISTTADFDAGAELLYRYKREWEKINKATEQAGQQANELNTEVLCLYKRCKSQQKAVSQFNNLIDGLPNLVEEIEDCISKIDTMQGQFKSIEIELNHLQEIATWEELNEQKTIHRQKLESYKQIKNAELAKIKDELAKQHTLKVEAHETKLRELLKAKLDAFDFTYTTEITNYKMFGATNLKASHTNDSGLDLGDIEIETDKSELDKFLDSDSPRENTERRSDAEPAKANDKDYNHLDSPRLTEEALADINLPSQTKEESINVKLPTQVTEKSTNSNPLRDYNEESIQIDTPEESDLKNLADDSPITDQEFLSPEDSVAGCTHSESQ